MTVTEQPNRTRRAIIGLAILVILGVIAAGPWRTTEQLRKARLASQDRDAATAARLDQLAADNAELLDLLDQARDAIERSAPAGELAQLRERITAAVETLRTRSSSTTTSTTTSTPGPSSTTTIVVPAPSSPAPTPVPCAARVLTVCVEQPRSVTPAGLRRNAPAGVTQPTGGIL